jgi:hypothetical protein
MKQQIQITELLARANVAFGFTFMKLAARFLQYPQYDEVDENYSEMSFVNTFSQNAYRFGIDGIGSGTPAFPFQTQELQIRKYLAPPPVPSFRRGKHVVKTAIDRAEAEVIEHFGLKPYTINLRGIIVDMDEHQYPGQLLSSVHEMFAEPGTFKAIGDIFYDLGIDEIFFEDDFSVEFVEGYADTVKYSVRATQVVPVEFQVMQQSNPNTLRY